MSNDHRPPPVEDDQLVQWYGVARRPVDAETSAAANRRWWDTNAQEYYDEHGAFLGDDELVWGPEGLTEDDLHILGSLTGRRILEIGAGAGQGSRFLARRGATVVASDLSGQMLARGRAIDVARARVNTTPVNTAAPPSLPTPSVHCDGRALPFAENSFDIVFTAYGVMPFVADPATVLAEAARVLRPGGRLAFSTTHPIRWAFPDDPGPAGLRISGSYFDRDPYVEETEGGAVSYVEHHRTVGDWVALVAAAGLRLVALHEPAWPERNTQTWGGWSPLRGRQLPGTLIVVADQDPDAGQVVEQ
ncbi:class I SAM-dependent methyltransferase [Dermacoccaceae bacterium W4C1]